MVLILISGYGFPGQKLMGQSPQFFSYQAVVNDLEGNPRVGIVGLRISILKGSDSGDAIYSERHSKETDINGLLSLRIGEGDVYTGEFESIDWSDGPFFLKVEIAPTGGYIYPISTTTALVSVPFALYALKADTVYTGYEETDPLFLASVAGGITAEDTNRWNTFSREAMHQVGDIYGGGIIFHIEPGGEHGLIASLTDIEDAVPWGNDGISAGASSSFDGSTNTASIVIAYGNGDYAAYHCDTLKVNGFTDWYLPSADELFLLYKARYIVNRVLEGDMDENTSPLVKDAYWTSTEKDPSTALLFTLGNQEKGSKIISAAVRSVRAF